MAGMIPSDGWQVGLQDPSQPPNVNMFSKANQVLRMIKNFITTNLMDKFKEVLFRDKFHHNHLLVKLQLLDKHR